MRSPAEGILSTIERDPSGIGVIWCPDFALRDWLVGEVESLAPEGSHPLRMADVASALVERGRMILLVPTNEAEAVRDLDANRDRLVVERTQPIVVFLLRHGDGERALSTEAVNLGRWLRGSDADPDALAEIDPVAERAAFVAAVGERPEEFLAKWRTEKLPNNSKNLGLSYWANLLEGTRE